MAGIFTKYNGRLFKRPLQYLPSSLPQEKWPFKPIVTFCNPTQTRENGNLLPQWIPLSEKAFNFTSATDKDERKSSFSDLLSTFVRPFTESEKEAAKF